MGKRRLLWLVIRRSGVARNMAIFMALYLVSVFLILIFEPGITTYSDALWFLWAVCVTVGLGDFTAVTVAGRIITVFLSLCAILTTAIITGMIVDYYNERRQAQFNESMTQFLDKLENLPNLSRDELEEMSEKVRKFRT